MAHEIKGDQNVCGNIESERSNERLTAKTITATESLTARSRAIQILTAASAQDVILPDATTLENGWRVVVKAITSVLTVKTYHSSNPVTLRAIAAGRTYAFTLLSNATAAGTWEIHFLDESDMVPSGRYSETFNATTDWGSASGGRYTMTITQSTHGRGTTPSLEVQEVSGSDYIDVEVEELKTLANGNVEIAVLSSPDCRFAGRAIFV